MHPFNSTNAFATPFMPGGCQAWGRLNTERQDVCEALLEEGKAVRKLASAGVVVSDLPIEDTVRELEWHRRESLQARLRQIDDALDRLMAGSYGHCSSCGKPIDEARLAADPAVPLCLFCQREKEGERRFRSL